MGDSFKEMKTRAKEKHFNFPYLYDGATEEVSKKYGPIATPHVFIFDKQRKLRYSGRIDDVEKPTKTPNSLDTRNAIDALLSNKEVPAATTKVFGCSVKWAEKSDWISKAKADWAKEPVRLDTISEQPAKMGKALQFLQSQQASGTNYIFSTDNKYKLIEAIDPKWQGALPYTVLVEPGGKIVYAKEGPVDPLELKRKIVNSPLVGRYY